jgi:hypothetical protein
MHNVNSIKKKIIIKINKRPSRWKKLRMLWEKEKEKEKEKEQEKEKEKR